MDFSKELLKAIAEKLLEGSIDQYGNRIPSPVDKALYSWTEKNREEISKLVITKIDMDKFAETMAKKMEEFTISRTIGSSYDRDRFTEEVKKKTIEVLANKLAEEKMNEKPE